MLARASGARTIEDTYPLIREAIHDLRDNHSAFMTPNDQQHIYNYPDPPLPTGQMLDDVGYVKIPYYFRTARLDYASFVDLTQTVIAQLDTSLTCGWVVDLRQNGGGNMWPMIAGLGPLLGDGILGYFKYSKGPYKGDQFWSYREGASRWNDSEVCARGNLPSYRLSIPNRPVAILVSKKTASSGEGVLISFIGRPNTRSFGTPTAGLSTTTSPFVLADGSKLHLTTGVFADRTGKTYGASIVPDEVIVSGASPHVPDADSVLERARNWLRHFRPL